MSRGAAVVRIALVALAAEASGCRSGPPIETADRLAASGYYEEALPYYRDALARSPENPHAWFRLGVALHLEGDRQAAREAFERAVAAPSAPTPLLAAAHEDLGVLLLEVNEPSRAVAHFRAAADLEPSAGAFAGLSLALARAGDLDGSCRAAERGAAQDPLDRLARRRLAAARAAATHPAPR